MSETPDIYYDRLAQLKPEEKTRLRAILTDPLYLRFLRIVAGMKPSANCTDAGSGKRDEFSDARANARLGEIRGWEWYEFAMFKALHDAPARPTEPEATFPDTGLLKVGPKLPNE